VCDQESPTLRTDGRTDGQTDVKRRHHRSIAIATWSGKNEVYRHLANKNMHILYCRIPNHHEILRVHCMQQHITRWRDILDILAAGQ